MLLKYSSTLKMSASAIYINFEGNMDKISISINIIALLYPDYYDLLRSILGLIHMICFKVISSSISFGSVTKKTSTSTVRINKKEM